MIGEPGLGKSQLLKGLYSIAPKAIYICGSSSSSAGLTVSLNKDSGSNDFSIEPGAVVLASNGACCIDEFDKIPQHHDSLLEVMEQQCVSIAKSGTRCNMQARTSIIAAANFNEGSYCKTKSFNQNTCFNSALLSRFDLIFLLLDKNNKKYDLRLADHLLNIRMNKFNQHQSQYFFVFLHFSW
uniref:Putative DNA helicase MCM8 (Trinotate prediction) n=1 Tax=Henneguya salminicola TaxID=69463 RepID=A0A6G3MDM5_HENSL